MREKGQTEVAKTLETPVFSRGIEILTEKRKFFIEESGASIAKFKDGTLGAFISGSWDAEAIREGLGDNFGVTKLPTIELDGEDCQLYSLTESKCIGVNPKRANKGGSVALAAYAGGEEGQKVGFEVRNIIPTSKSLIH